MKRLFVAGFGLLALVGAASAADLPPRYPVMQPRAPIYNPVYTWTGFYVGINGGGGWGRSTWDGVDKFNVSGGMIGVTAGYNYQYNQIVFGIEADLDWSGVKGNTFVNCPGGCTTRNDWLSTVRGRVGFSFDRFMPYITAGVALGDIKATPPVGLPGGTGTNIGWTVGAGFEVALVGAVTAKAEYLYVDLGNYNCGFNCGLAGSGNASFYANIVRGGINYRF
jgi:outer membrane immunogenic protein